MKKNSDLPSYWRVSIQKGRRESLVVFLFSMALFLSLFGFSVGNQGATEGSVFRQLIWTLFGLAAFAHILRDRIGTGKMNFSLGGGAIWLIVIYALITTFWSTTPPATLKRATLLVILLILAISCFGDRRGSNIVFAKVLGWAVFPLIISSILITAIAPSFAITDIGWRGVTTHKNELGQAIAIALLTTIYGGPYRYVIGVKRFAAICLLVVGLFLTQSSTSLLAAFLAVVITGAISLLVSLKTNAKLSRILLALGLFFILTGYLAFLADAVPDLGEVHKLLLGGLGKSETLTGRTELWSLVLSQSIYHNTLFGGGYGGFWVGPDSVSAYTAYRSGIYLGQAHNGYIDIYNDMGWVGLVLVSLVILGVLFNVFKLVARGCSEWKLCFSILIAILVANYAESTLMRSTQFLNIVFFATVVFSRRLVISK